MTALDPRLLDYRSLFESAPGLLLVLDPAYVIVAATDAYLAATGTVRPEIIGRYLFGVFPDNPDDPDSEAERGLRASLDRVVSQLTTDLMALTRYDTPDPGADGDFVEKYWSPSNTPLLDEDGQLKYIIHRVEDVTEYVKLRESAQGAAEPAGLETPAIQRMEAEILKQRAETAAASRDLKEANVELDRLYRRTMELDELKTRFFANVSHELRTPLTLILGPVRRLLELDSTQEQRRLFELIEANGSQLLEHVNNLLDLAKVETGTLELDYAEVDLSQLVGAAGGQFETFAHDEGVTFVVRATPVRAQIDPDRFHQVLLNLLSNALKFTPSGGTVRCEVSVEEPGEAFQLEVADSGAGVPVPDRESVFDRFRQLDPGPSGRRSGTGLGLAIVKEIVQSHGGRISIGEAAEGGASFMVHLPLRAAAGTHVRQPGDDSHLPREVPRMPLSSSKSAMASEASKPRYRATAAGQDSELPLVLVVEDNQALGEFIGDVLASDFRVILAGDGAQGLRFAREVQPDLILSDVMMPRMSGDELLRLVRADDDLAAVPFVILTARADERLLVDLLRAGANDFIAKPFMAQELLARVSNLVRGRRAEIQSRDLAAALKTANDSLQDFVAVASHDLRSPLSTIAGFAELLTNDWATLSQEDRLNHLGAINRGVGRLTRLTNDLLTSARIEGAADVSKPEHIRVDSELAGYLEANRPEPGTVEVSCPAELVAVVDPSHFARILDNYVGNALKYGEPPVHIEAERVGDFIEVRVRDEGPGVPPEFEPRLFTKFGRADTPATRSTQGTGLGLSIVKALAEANGGDAVYRRNEPSGGCFVVRLPAAV